MVWVYSIVVVEGAGVVVTTSGVVLVGSGVVVVYASVVVGTGVSVGSGVFIYS